MKAHILIFITVFSIILTSCEVTTEPETHAFELITNSEEKNQDFKNEETTKKQPSSRERILTGFSKLYPEVTLNIDTLKSGLKSTESFKAVVDSINLVSQPFTISSYIFFEFNNSKSCDSAFFLIRNMAETFTVNDTITRDHHLLLPKAGIAYFKTNNCIAYKWLNCGYTSRSYNELKIELEKYRSVFPDLDFFIVKCGSMGQLVK